MSRGLGIVQAEPKRLKTADKQTEAGDDPVQPWRRDPGEPETGHAHQRFNQPQPAMMQAKRRK